MTQERMMVEQSMTHPGAADAELLDHYMNMLDRFGPDSREAKDFVAEHPDAKLTEFSTSVHELESSAKKSRRVRLLVPVVWLASFLVIGLIGGVAVLRGTEALTAQKQANHEQAVAQDRTSELNSTEAGWGWTMPNALPEKASPAEYLDHLKVGAKQYFDKPPQTAVDLAKRVGEFRKGCAVLLLTQQTPLTTADQKWLMDKCQLWAEHFENDLNDLERKNGTNFSEVNDKVNKEVNALVKQLEEKAQEVQAGA
jgi:hypothetical protein